jgi:hypothetical protein
MSKTDVQWCVDQLKRYITLCQNKSWEDAMDFDEGLIDEQLTAQSQIVEQIFDRVIPSWRAMRLSESDIAIRAKAQLEHEDEIAEHLGDNAPEMDAGKLHPWVWKNAASYWKTGHYRQAVLEAAKCINAETQNKVNRRDVSEHKLFEQCFSMDLPKERQPRLRLMEDDGSDTYKNLHVGASSFARGLYSAIRNPGMHESSEDELDEHIALEQLAAFSILARWVDEANVETLE